MSGHGGKREGAGAPKGNKNSSLDNRLVGNTIKRALAQNPDKLRNMVDRILDDAADGSIVAANFIADRVDGKPAQSIQAEVNTAVRLVDLSGGELGSEEQDD